MKKIFLVIISLIMTLLLSACSFEEVSLNLADSSHTTVSEGKFFEKPASNEYDSKDTAIITAISTQKKLISFYNYDLQKSYTLTYDTGTRFADSYNTIMSVSQLKPGTLVDIRFLKSAKRLVSLNGNSDCFVMSDVTDFSIDSHGVFKYKSENYEITKGTVLISANMDMDLTDLCSLDIVTLVGKDTTLYSIIVDRGHGYLSLDGYEKFIGGYLEIGNSMIERIREKMLLTIPEGTYKINISKNRTKAEKNVEIKANSETILNLGDIEMEEDKLAQVFFDTTPATAKLYIDGKAADPSEVQYLGYGRHKLEAVADGYENYTRYFMVGEKEATLPVIMEPLSDKKEETEKKDDDTTTENTEVTDGFFIYITAPVGVEVYQDNIYIGLAPVMIAKKPGNHVITLKKAGYTTKTYDIQIPEEEGDVTYSFSNLEVDIFSTILPGIG